MPDLTVQLYGFGNTCLAEYLAESHMFIPFNRRGQAKGFQSDVDMDKHLN